MWQFGEAVEGIGEACRALDVPITGGNVSLYNETDGTRDLSRRRSIGVVGLLEDASRVLARTFREAGARRSCCSAKARASSAAASTSKTVHGLVRGVPPALDLAARARAARAARRAAAARAAAVGARLLRRRPRGHARRVLLRHRRRSACDVDRAGRGPTAGSNDAVATLFGESASRVVVSVRPADRATLLQRAAEAGVPARVIGETGGDAAAHRGRRRRGDRLRDPEAERIWETALERYFASTGSD